MGVGCRLLVGDWWRECVFARGGCRREWFAGFCGFSRGWYNIGFLRWVWYVVVGYVGYLVLICSCDFWVVGWFLMLDDFDVALVVCGFLVVVFGGSLRVVGYVLRVGNLFGWWCFVGFCLYMVCLICLLFRVIGYHNTALCCVV